MQSSKIDSSSTLLDNHPDEEVPRTQCVQCGTCCMKGGPTLHLEDVRLLGNGIIKRADLYTVRKGEAVFNNLEGNASVLSEEIIKLKARDERGSCIFYDHSQRTCTIYENRPLECRALKCWDTKDLEAIFEKDRLQRKHLIPPDTLMAETIAAHEQRCSYLTLETLIKKMGGPEGPEATEAVEKVLEQLRFDHYLRPFISKKLGLPIEDMNFFFGRPLTRTISMFGLQVKQDGDTFLLVPME